MVVQNGKQEGLNNHQDDQYGHQDGYGGNRRDKMVIRLVRMVEGKK